MQINITCKETTRTRHVYIACILYDSQRRMWLENGSRNVGSLLVIIISNTSLFVPFMNEQFLPSNFYAPNYYNGIWSLSFVILFPFIETYLLLLNFTEFTYHCQIYVTSRFFANTLRSRFRPIYYSNLADI